MDIYIAGPMTGIPEFNFPAFREASIRLQQQGHTVVDPAAESFAVAGQRKLGDVPREEYMHHDLRLLLDCDAVAVLPGWERSQGACLEVAVARGVGIPILDAATLEPIQQHQPPDEDVLQEALRITAGNRQTNYGSPDKNFAQTGRLWADLLGLPEPISARMVAMMMIAVKLSRETNRPTRDNAVDIAGYARCLWLCNQAEQQ